MSNTEYAEHQIQKFVSNEMKHTPGADEDILRFIADILYHCGAGNVEDVYKRQGIQHAKRI